MTLDDLVHLAPLDRRDARRRDRLDVVIHLGEQADMEVAAIARHQEGQHLPGAVRQDLVPARPAFEDDEHGAGPVALADQVASGGNAARPGGCFGEDCLVTLIERHKAPQFFDEPVRHRPSFPRGDD